VGIPTALVMVQSIVQTKGQALARTSPAPKMEVLYFASDYFLTVLNRQLAHSSYVVPKSDAAVGCKLG
jgi:hypothetical protein